MKVSLEYYKIFYFVAKNKSITAAAKELYLSQPTVSKYIQNLEKELDCKLFLRSKKGVTLTPEANKLYEQIAKAYRHILIAEEELENQKYLMEGALHIGASEMTMQHFLLPFLELYRKRYPNIKLKISNYSTPGAIKQLKAGLIDFAVIITPIEDTDLNVTKLKSFEDVFIISSALKMPREESYTLNDISKYPLISLMEGTSSRKYLEDMFLKEGLVLTPDIELATTDLIVPCVSYGLGIGFVPTDFAKQAIKSELVSIMPMKKSLPYRYICAVRDENQPLSIAATKLLEMICVNSDD